MESHVEHSSVVQGIVLAIPLSMLMWGVILGAILRL